jgi:cation:H+ antiporter
MGLSPLFVGLTIVGFGTSTPELGASVTGSLAGSSEVSVGNVVGSNLFNLGVILALTAIIRPIRIHLSMLRRDLGVAVAAAAVPWLAILTAGRIGAVTGVGLLAVLVAYLTVAYRSARRASSEEVSWVAAAVPSVDPTDPDRSSLPATPTEPVSGSSWWTRTPVSVAMVLVGLACLVLGSRFFVLASLDIARGLGISELVIGLTLVAMGTSLPELVTSVVAALRGNPDIAVGNVLGSNIFNSFGILGVAALITPQAVPRSVAAIDVPVLILLTVAVIPFIRTGSVLSRREGLALLAAYGVYLVVLLGRSA